MVSLLLAIVALYPVYLILFAILMIITSERLIRVVGRKPA